MRPARAGILALAALVLFATACVGVGGREGLGSPGEATHQAVAPEAGTPAAYTNHFPVGVFEDAALLDGHVGRWEAMIVDLKSRGFDSVLVTNGHVERDRPLLEMADRMGFGLYYGPHFELAREWWPQEVPAEGAVAEQVIAPLVERLRSHPSVKGYYLVDEPGLELGEKVAIASRVFERLDPTRPVFPLLVGLDRVGPLFTAARAGVMVVDVYPLGAANPLGDFSLGGFGYPGLDFVDYLRRVTASKPSEMPLWVVLQTHRFAPPDGRFALREPVPAEVRAQQWLALGEGATGVFWFIYSSQQGWRGLADNPTLFDEVSRQAQRLGQLRPVLSGVEKVPDRFVVTSEGRAYVSTLAGAGGRTLVVAVNRDVENHRSLTVGPSGRGGTLRDLETGATHRLGEEMVFPPGDGKIFEYSATAAVGTVAPERR